LIPELDHSLNETWAGLPKEYKDLLDRCVTRRVQVVVKNETNTVQLVGPSFKPVPVAPAGPGSAAATSTGKVIRSFRIADVVYGANVLRASSNPTRVRVTRASPTATNRWEFDVTRIQVTSTGPFDQTKLWWHYAFWLRDGDVIEIPDR
jgi:hypothetical protein